MPYTAEDYVHRIGRTGRAGLPGEAISLVSPEENRLLVEVEKLLKRKLPRVEAPAFDRAASPAPQRTRISAHERHERKPYPARASTNAAVNHNPESAFDFSKPYEAAPESESRASDAVPITGRHRAQRPTAALLGGGPAPHHKSKNKA
jgi:superfamily II DNA/RNA helicase